MTFGLSAATLGTIATVGGSIAGGLIASNGAQGAADTQAQASRDATQAQRDIFERQVQLQEPWRRLGESALNPLAYMMGLNPQQATPGAAGPAMAPRAEIPGPVASTGALSMGVANLQQAAPSGPSADQIRQWYDAGLLRANGAGQPFINSLDGSTIDANLVSRAVAGFSDSPQTPVAPFTQPQAVQAQMQQQQAAPVAPMQGDANSFNGSAGAPGFGSMLHNFNSADFQNDPAFGLTKNFSAEDFQADPGYAFRQSEQEKALQRAASAAGGLGSGKYLKDAMSYSGGLAAQEYQSAYNRFNTNRDSSFNKLASIAGIGQTATNQLSNAAATFGSQIGSNIIGAGNAQAAGQVGSANALNSGIGQGLSMYQQQNMLNKLLNRGSVAGSGFGGGGLMDDLKGYGVF